MRKTIQYQNPNVIKKDKVKETVSTSLKQIPFSIIVPVKDQNEQVNHFAETLKKIKQENYSKFEVIVVNNNASQEVLSVFETNDIFKTLKDQQLLKIINPDSAIDKTKAIYLGITNASKENVLVFDIDKLNNSFNINDLFSAKKDLRDKIGIPVFQTKEKTKKPKYNYSLVIAPVNIAKLLYANLLPSDTKYQLEVKYKITQMGIEVEEMPIFQSSPFIDSKQAHICTRIFRTFYSRLNWYFVTPLKELTSKPDRQLLPDKLKESSVYRFAFAALAIILFFVIPMMSYHSGNSGDEDKDHYPQSLRIYKYYTSFGKDTTYKQIKEMEAYGQSFDTFTVFFNKIFNVEKIFETRHVMNGMVGWLALLFCGLLAYILANWRAGLITMFLVFFSPPFFGQCFNNNKDIPFAMAYIFTIYFIVKFIKEYPKIKLNTSIYIALGIAMAISVRIGGLLLIAYTFMFFGMYFLFTVKLKELFSADNIAKMKKLIIYAVIISIAGYFMGLILWPYALEAPLSNPYKALVFMTNFSTASLRQLYEGVPIWSDKVPLYYTSKYILITVPIVVLVGAVLNIITIRKKDFGYFWAFVLFFSFGFPIFYMAYKHSNVYGGWRHALFAFPPLAVIAGVGFSRAIDFIKNNKFKFLGLIAIVLMAYSPITHTIKNHPYEYVYFNEFAGGVKGAYGNYELDYYFHSLKEASEWVIKNGKKDDPNDKTKIKVGAWLTPPLNYYFRNDTAKFQVVFLRYYERGNVDWDYAIFVNTGIDAAQLKNGTFPPANTVHTIDVDGKPICAIVKRTDKHDLFGEIALQKNDTANIIPNLRKAVEALPTNEAALLNLADAYTRVQKFDSADMTIKKLLKFDPELDNALYSQAIIYFYKNDLDNALQTCNHILKNNYKYYMAHYIAANIYANQQNLSAAKTSLEKLLQQNQGFKPAYMMLAKIAQSEGDNDAAQRYMNMANQLQ